MKRNLRTLAVVAAAMAFNIASALPAEAPRGSKAAYDEVANAVTITATAPQYTEYDWNSYYRDPLDHISKVTIERHAPITDWPDEPVGVLTDVEPGGEIRFVDTTVQPDQKYEYRITCYVDDEKGSPTWVSAYTGIVPGAMQAFTLSTPDHETAQFDVSLTAPSTTASGNPMTGKCTIEVEMMMLYTWYTVASIPDVEPGQTIEFPVIEGVELNTSYNLRAYARLGENGSGESLEASIYVGEDTPTAPDNLTWTQTDDAITLEWELPETGANNGSIDPDNVKYNIYIKTINDDKFVMLTEKHEGELYTYPLNLVEEEVMEFGVAAVNGKGESYYMAQTPELTAGPHAAYPFSESFAGNMFQHRGWTYSTDFNNMYSDKRNVFTLEYLTEYYSPDDIDILINPQDNDGGLVTTQFPSYGPEGYIESLTTPRIDFSTSKNPMLSFWYYHIPTPDFFSPHELSVKASAEGGEFEEVFFTGDLEKGDTHEWKHILVPLEALAGKQYGQIRFDAIHSTALYNVTLDNIEINEEMGFSGISSAEADINNADAPVEYFNLQGVRVANPEGGIFIRRQGNKVEKVTIR